MNDRLPEDDDGVLTRLAQMIADGDPVDWEEEADRTPGYDREMRDLRWIEAITIARRISVRAQAGPSKSARTRRPRETRSSAASSGERQQSSRPAPPFEPLAPGTTWGRLRIISRVGEGAAGDVYRALDPTLGREVALKILRESGDYRTTGTEARRLSRVKHPSVVAVLGYERHGAYAGMWTDFLQGKNLEEVLEERGPLPLSETCIVGTALCDALEAIHAAGMVHRDIKAANVMCLADQTVVLIDFSSIKDLPRGVPEHSEHIRGTPLSTAPELLRGGPVEPLADIYSMGVLLYRLVTGAYPIEARTLAELVEKIESWPVVPMRVRRPELHRGFADLVDRTVSRDPRDRPQSARALRRELMNVLDGT